MPVRSSVLRAAVLGFCCLFVGIGIGRFGYPALIPALIGAGWTSEQIAHLAAAFNLAGYLAGAVMCVPLMRRTGARLAVIAALWLTVASFALPALPMTAVTFCGLRFLSGVTGGALMTAVVPLVMQMVDPSRRGRAGGFAFAGAGTGFMVSGAVVPALASRGVAFGWLSIAAVLSVASVVAWLVLPKDAPRPALAAAPERVESGSRAVIGLTIVYCACAVGYVPATVIFVDYVSRVLGLGLAVGGAVWAATGVGAVLSPLLTGFVAERIGFAWTLRLVVLTMAVSAAIPAFTNEPLWLALSGAGAGGLIIALAPLTSGRARDIGSAARHPALWARLTVLFAVMQALGAYALSGVLAVFPDYGAVFLTAAAVMGCGLMLETALSAGARAAED